MNHNVGVCEAIHNVDPVIKFTRGATGCNSGPLLVPQAAGANDYWVRLGVLATTGTCNGPYIPWGAGNSIQVRILDLLTRFIHSQNVI